jgi:hypothetical protein
MRKVRLILAVSLSALLLSGEAAHQSVDPALAVSEFPVELLSDCSAVAVSAGRATCPDANYRSRWLMRAPHGHLFLIETASCTPRDCRSWFVEKRAGGARVLLAATGVIKLERLNGSYPSVEVRSVGKDDRTSYHRYAWNGERYMQIDSRLVHRVAGIECAGDDCLRKAADALSMGDAELVVEIWKQVEGVEWI